MTEAAVGAYETINVERRDAVTRIELNRPEALNAFTPQLGGELLDAVRRASGDSGVRALLLTGAGRAFSAGADVKQSRTLTAEGQPDLSSSLREVYNPIIFELRAAPKPVVAAVNGPAAGIGCSLALACDQIVAAESAYFLLAFVRIGLIPDGGASYLLPARIGLARATRLAMLGERLPAPEALDWGLVDEVCPEGELAERAGALAARLAAGPTVALANMKRALGAAVLPALAKQLELEATLQQEHAATADYAEGVLAFKEKRETRFEGR